jgi:hypothetical protein
VRNARKNSPSYIQHSRTESFSVSLKRNFCCGESRVLSSKEFLETGLQRVAEMQTGELVSKKDYHKRLAYSRFLSHSTREVLHSCKRKFELSKILAYAKQEVEGVFVDDRQVGNIDLVFGHVVGTGVQHFIMTKDMNASIWQAFLAWNADLMLDDEKKKKGWGYAVIAIQKFATYFKQYFPHHELAILYGRPAIELTFSIDLKNGYKYFGHIDAILRDLSTGELFVLEIKTTGRKWIDPAMYQNSEQPLGYTCVLDKIAHNLGDYASFNVVYFVYLTGQQEYEILPFPKSRAHRAEFLQSLLMDCDEISRSRHMGFFPKNGSSCFDFSRTCQFFGLCNLSNSRFGNGTISNIDQIPRDEEVVDSRLQFSVDDLIEVQLTDL